MVMLEVEAEHGGLLIDQVNTLVPTVSPVMVVTGEVGVVITPLPETFIHTPVPTPGAFAAIVAVGDEIQTV